VSPSIDQRRLRVLRVLAVLITTATIAIFLLDGRPVISAVVGGATIAGLTFVLTAGILFLYWGIESTITR